MTVDPERVRRAAAALVEYPRYPFSATHEALSASGYPADLDRALDALADVMPFAEEGAMGWRDGPDVLEAARIVLAELRPERVP